MNTVEFRFLAQCEPDTQLLGACVAAVLQPGDVVGLVGNLGAGKTRLVKAIADGLGCDSDDVTSPTFVLIQEYSGSLKLYHFDTYRLADSDEFLELGVDELLFGGDGVCIVEWSDRVADVLPKDMLRIQIEHVGETIRRFECVSSGSRSSELIGQIMSEFTARGGYREEAGCWRVDPEQQL